MHPLDLVKVRFQLANTPLTSAATTAKTTAMTTPSPVSTADPMMNLAKTPSAGAKPRFGTAVYSALKDCVKQDGWAGLYRGLTPNLVGGASSWGLYFLL